MTLALTQDQRPARLKTPFGGDVLNLVRFDGHEAISTAFDYAIEAVSTEAGLDFDKALGRNCAVTFHTYGKAQRHFNGVLTESEWLGKRGGLHHYRLKLQPWFSLLGFTANCRFFQDMSVTDIIRKVFTEAGFSDFLFKTSESYEKIEYCVQYRESDLAFVSRLMEHYGIYYFFEHTADKHEMILADGRSSHQPVPGLATLPFRHLAGTNVRDEQHITEWKPVRRFQSGKVSLNDFDYLKPNASLLAEKSQPGGYAKSGLEVYDYHASYQDRGKGEKLARVRLEARQALDFRRECTGDAASLAPGGLTTLKDHQEASENIPYLVVACTHRIHAQGYLSGEGGGTSYEGSYRLQPAGRPFRAPAVTPRPVISGPQTAKVVGKAGEEIDVDEHGRILVQFHWDRDRKPSRRVRVAQTWSGKSWGGVVIPRIGMEVVVEFIEGDPDYPLVTGTVYNGDNRPPYELPANKTMAGVKSRSSKNDNGYNELVFEDKASSEKIRMHAEKDLDITVKNSETREIGAEFPVPMGQPSRKTQLKSGDDELSVDTGNQTVKVAQTMTLKAGLMIELVCGASKITMTPASIDISSPLINIKAAAVLNAQGTLTNVSGAANLALRGGLVLIN
ncbi:type VI secretion system Vgr family protein [Phreatobacter sp. AB_2022a]|uniref:type VI secretion system Vgr family protein n=1 Tax=Phreatobacter sp. AB_2022a TaxID=3003134 RepID=UPI0022874E83|nr:type VI secretion system tip protein TssI/VgrG [Phreatobacter sp. AB_2022a]MCZ0737642.1 type VI secretion system tip protein TssI/VgrG [Phreatobacter sp. AB_2022a]